MESGCGCSMQRGRRREPGLYGRQRRSCADNMERAYLDLQGGTGTICGRPVRMPVVRCLQRPTREVFGGVSAGWGKVGE